MDTTSDRYEYPRQLGYLEGTLLWSLHEERDVTAEVRVAELLAAWTEYKRRWSLYGS